MRNVYSAFMKAYYDAYLAAFSYIIGRPEWARPQYIFRFVFF